MHPRGGGGGVVIELRAKRLHDSAILPTQAKPGDAGWDLYSNESRRLYPGLRLAISTGIALELPHGYVGLVCPRSGLARNYGVTVLNAPGVIDSGYRGEIIVLLQSCSDITHMDSSLDVLHIQQGDRIAQLLVMESPQVVLSEVETLGDSERGDSGFGSSGK